MWIVLLALRRPYTFVVAAMLVVILGLVTILRTPTDIFPNIDIPVVAVLYRYPGMTADDMEKKLVSVFERFVITVANDIEHIESQSFYGTATIKIYFQKGAKIEAAIATIAGVCTAALREQPPGTDVPLMIRYSATNVPIIQLSLSSDTLSEQQIFDIAINQLRPQLMTIPGIQIPYPYGGKQRQIMVDLDPQKLYAWGLSASDVSAAISAQNLVLPAGTAKMGTQDYPVLLNSSPDAATQLADIPVRTVGTTTVYLRDVAHVRDGFSVQTNVAHAGGKRGALMSVLKSGNVSTLDVVAALKANLPRVKSTLPADFRIEPMFDQSVFVRNAVEGVVKEAALAAALTGLMILMFLGSWRSTVIVMVSIPLSIIISIIILSFIGETLNVMTLGGMALVVGMLVDDATVEIENIHRNLHMRKRLVQAILDGAQQIAVPAFVSTLCICIVFVPVLFISGAAKYLFTPLAEAVVFAMMSSYVISRTLVPTMVHYLLAPEVERYGGVLDNTDPHALGVVHDERLAERIGGLRGFLMLPLVRAGLIGGSLIVMTLLIAAIGPKDWAISIWLRDYFTASAVNVRQSPATAMLWLVVIGSAVALLVLGNRYSLLTRYHDAFNNQFEKLRRWYGGMLAWCLGHRLLVVIAFTGLMVSAFAIMPMVGQDFFPSVDAGLVRLHVRAPAGTRIEETERYFAQVAELIRSVIPDDEIDSMLDNIGIPYSGINTALSDGTIVSPADGEVLISLKEHHKPTADYIVQLKRKLDEQLPELITFFQPPDMASQVLNFGVAAPIDIQISGPRKNMEANFALIQQMRRDVEKVPGAVDVRLQQVMNTPDIRVDVDRTLAGQMGLSQRDVANDLLISLASNGQTSPNFWTDQRTGVNYHVMVQTPQYRIDTMDALNASPVASSGGRTKNMQLLGNLATVRRGYSPANLTHYDIQNTFDIQLGIRGTDLETVARGVQKVIDEYTPKLPKGSFFTLRGQAQSMHSSFAALGYGIIFAIVLVYLLMVINFQSWLDPLIILMALPGAIAGIVWILFVTGTTLSVPALMGAIMSIGVATANSILMVTFANDQREEGLNAHDAALCAGMTRLRPVLMTAAAMLIGMLPMAMGMGEGGEQNAPLGRAVIGGLFLATFATLILVPVMYSWLRKAAPSRTLEPELQYK